MNEKVHRLLRSIKSTILDITTGKPVVSLVAKTKNVLNKVLDFVNKYENKNFELVDVNVYSKISAIDSLLRQLQIVIESKEMKNKAYNESNLIIEVSNNLNAINTVLKKLSLPDLDAEEKRKLLLDESKDKIEYIWEHINECKRQLSDYEDDLQKRRSNLEGLEEWLGKKSDSIEEKQDLFEKNLQAQNEKFTKKIQGELSKLANNIYEEELAGYFHKERLALKGDIKAPIVLGALGFSILITISLLQQSTSIFFNIPKGISLCIFYMGIFSLLLLIIDFLFECIQYRNIINSIMERSFNFTSYLNINFELKTVKGLITPYWCWLFGIFLGMGSIFSIALERYISLKDRGLNFTVYLENIIPSALLCMILIWFTWFCSKQFSYTKQLCDEYEYKYVLSKSYLRYRDEARELGDNTKVDSLLISLLDAVIKNIATSPVQSVKSDCHTPIAELMKVLEPMARKVKNDENK